MLASAGCSTQEMSAVTGTSEAPVETEVPVAEAAPDNSDDQFVSAYPAFAVTSESLDGNIWIEACSNTEDGQNASPELSWEPIEGATVYVIYMVDINANNFLHWKSADVTETNLPQGWAPSSDYVGPYPPKGSTHTYSIFVFALKNEPGKTTLLFDAGSNSVNKIYEGLNTDVDGNTGNVLAYGRLDGNFTNK